MPSVADMIGQPTAPELSKPPELTSIEDTGSLRDSIFDRVKTAAVTRFPIENERYRIELKNIGYKGNKPFTKADQKDALVKGKSLNWRLYGDWKMIDKASGQAVDERKGEIVAHVPYMTERGTFVREGSEYCVSNQSRLRAGAYSRRKANGELETHFNVLDGGRSFRVGMDPATAQLTMHVGGAKMRMYPILRNMGVTDDALRTAWGTEIFNRNQADDDSAKRALAQFHRGPEDAESVKLKDVLGKMQLDPEITEQTLGAKHSNVTPDALIRATGKLLNISKGIEHEDDRDALHYQKIMFPDDLIAERIEKDWDKRLTGKLLWQSSRKGQLAVYPGHLTPQIDAVFTKSGLGQMIEECNPIETLDQRYRVLRTGEGGISESGIPKESRNLQSSHFGFIDPARSPESGKVGVDSRLGINIYRGSDGQIYSPMRNAAGKIVPVSAKQAVNSVIAFPGEMARSGQKVRAMVHGKLDFVDRKLVDYELAHPSHMFTVGSNLVSMISATGGARALMGAKFFNQATAMADPESPLVQAMSDDGKNSFEELYGTKAGGAVRSHVAGRVAKVTKDSISVETPTGTEKFDLYNNFPYNRQSYVYNTPTVSPGDHVAPGQLLARSNFTDAQGRLALGKNLRVAYMAWRGLNHEDAIVISESASKKLTSEHLIPVKIDFDTHTQRGQKEYMSLFPTRFNQDQHKTLGEDGVVKVGQTVKKGDPLVLAVRERPQTEIHRGRKPGWMDASEVWDHESDGTVTDVDTAKNGVRVYVKTNKPMQVADKMSGRFGDKGVVAEIVPDGQMPRDKDGNPMEVLLNPLGIVTRSNPSQLAEAILGKIAAKTGKPYKMPGFQSDSLIDSVIAEAKKHGIIDTEDLQDPQSNRVYRGILTGNRFLMKLHFMAEKKMGARDVGGYSMEQQPARGGIESAKRLGVMELNSLLSAGATEILKDNKTIRGQQNDEFWKAFQLGHTPPSPEVPLIYKKFQAHLLGAGINLKKSGSQLNIMAMTDKDIDKLSRGEIKEPKGINAATMLEIPGGLFDKSITGGHNGAGWGAVTLNEPIPNPIMEEPIRRLLGLTKQGFEDIITGKNTLNGRSGGEAIQEALRRIKLPDVKARSEDDIKSGATSRRSDAIKLLRYANMMEKTGLRPEDFCLSKIPVIPPIFRPIAATSKFVIKSDVNGLYVDLMKHNKALQDVKTELGTTQAGEERLNLYNSFKALTGITDPINPKLRNQGVRGLLRQVMGSSPKLGMYQSRVLGGTLDQSGLAVITPNPSLDMDHVGLPEKQAWTLYKKFVVRGLVRKGMRPTDAIKAVANQSPQALDVLQAEMEARPMIINRAPTLHKYNLMAAYPTLTKGHTLQVCPLTMSGYAADADGDTMMMHVPVSDSAVAEAKQKMMPSRNLFAIRDFDVHYLPSQEYAYGLHLASSKKNKKEPQAFATVKAAIAAYKRGEVDIDDRIRVR